MITELTEDQIARMPSYVQKWTEIGLSTEPCNVDETKKWVIEAYKNVNMTPPKYFFHFQSPFSAVHAVYMVERLSSFTDGYTDTKLHHDMSKYLAIFDRMYDQYSAQYTEREWNDNVKARMLSYVSQGYASGASSLPSLLDHFMYGYQECNWLSYYDFFKQEFNLDFIDPLNPFFEIAKNCGWWSAYSEVVFLQDRPTKISINEANELHCDDGPAVAFADGYNIYALQNLLFDERIVMAPETITVKEIDAESNAEKRRIMMERYGMDRYFNDCEPEVLDRDFVTVDPNEKTAMPRMLIKTRNGDMYLIGSDGSTNRVYYMPISNAAQSRVGQIKTCKQAHELISGLDESLCVAQS